jgi:hypothetical protein
MLLQIRGCQLPGRTWRSRDEHHDNVHVGIQVGKQPRELVPRFVYLTWGDVGENGSFAMFRRPNSCSPPALRLERAVD